MKDINDVRTVEDIIYRHKGILKFDNILDELKVSKKTIERKFKKVTGLTVKNYIRLVRFNNSLRNVRKDNSNRNWIDIAIECGYYDQSHFISEFKEFTGNPPNKYLTKRDLLADIYVPF